MCIKTNVHITGGHHTTQIISFHHPKVDGSHQCGDILINIYKKNNHHSVTGVARKFETWPRALASCQDFLFSNMTIVHLYPIVFPVFPNQFPMSIIPTTSLLHPSY